MTKEQFRALAHLLTEAEVVALGYDKRTLKKFVACGVLVAVKPPGTDRARRRGSS